MNSDKSLRFQQFFAVVVSVIIIILLVFYGYRPVSYNLSIGSVCNRDIYAPRSFIDSYQTEYRAIHQKNEVSAIFVRSEDIANENVEKVSRFFEFVRETRALRLDSDGLPNPNFADEVDALSERISDELGFVPDEVVMQDFISMTNSAFNLIENKSVAMAEIIMMENINTDNLQSSIDDQIDLFNEGNHSISTFSPSISAVLSGLLSPNSVFDQQATEEAAENAYLTAKNDPVIVDKGTKIVSSGEVITEHIYKNLVDLELIRSDSFDLVIIGRVACFEIVIAFATVVYLVNTRKHEFNDMKVVYTLVLTFLIPIAASVYLADVSTIMVVTLFFTTIAATYLGLSVGIVLSVAQVFMLWPLYSFDIEFLFVSFVGVLICSAIASNTKRSYNSAGLIIFPSLLCVVSSVAYNWLLGSTLNIFIQSAVWTGVSVMFSIVIAIGLMPIYELMSNTVSPVKLIELSQPGRPLLKRMFIEASGTYHHSMMVANLADSAAESIGADALLCKVAAYYHDIGKLENPRFFTENQSEGYNPHDEISTEESVAIITNHILDGAKLAKHYKLPEPIIRIIDEHHGTTYPAYFYFKAKKQAQENGEAEPNIDDFKYKGHIPSSRESAIVMIADTCEAAIRSMKLTDPQKIEETIRDLIKKKVDQDQLIKSGLSFDDLEKIIVSFRQAYAGTFHERIQYPNEK